MQNWRKFSAVFGTIFLNSSILILPSFSPGCLCQSFCCERGVHAAGQGRGGQTGGGIPPRVISKNTTGLGSVVSAMVVAVQLAGAKKRVGCANVVGIVQRSAVPTQLALDKLVQGLVEAIVAASSAGGDSTRDSSSRDVGLDTQSSDGRAKAPLDRRACGDPWLRSRSVLLRRGCAWRACRCQPCAGLEMAPACDINAGFGGRSAWRAIPRYGACALTNHGNTQRMTGADCWRAGHCCIQGNVCMEEKRRRHKRPPRRRPLSSHSGRRFRQA